MTTEPAADRDPILEAALIAAGRTTLAGDRAAQMQAAIDAVTPLIRLDGFQARSAAAAAAREIGSPDECPHTDYCKATS